MAELLQDLQAQLVLWVALLAILLAVAVYIIKKLRGEAVQEEDQERSASELISKFRELHSRGGLTDAEFRTIKTKLAARLQEELKDNGETG